MHARLTALAALILALALFPSGVVARASTQAFPGEEARTEMARLAPLAGDWQARVSVMQPDGEWRVAGEERASIHFMLNDLALREEAPDHPVSGFRLEATIQYDQNRDEYRLVAMDDTWGNMDVHSGQIHANGDLVMDNLASDTSFVGQDGSTRHFRLTTRIIDFDHNVFSVEMSADRGESWTPYQRIERTRLGSPPGN